MSEIMTNGQHNNLDDDFKSCKFTISDYEYFEHRKSFLGHGAFGEVYSGQRIKDKLPVAIKKVNQMKVDQNEIDIMKSVQHENVLQLLHVDMKGNHLYMITELCTCDLSIFLQKFKGILSVKELYKAAEQLAKGYRALHEKNIIHRDIKPANILLVEKGGDVVYKIADFGCSRFLQAPYASSFAGSVMYMAPELGSFYLKSGSPHYDHRADIWSLGVVLYECATGKYPFSEEDLQKLFFSNGALSAADELFNGIDTKFALLLNLMLEVNYKDRLTASGLIEFVSNLMPPVKRRILVIGESGSGKSSVIKLLTNDATIKTSDGVTSCTLDCNYYTHSDTIYIDTPSLGEESLDDGFDEGFFKELELLALLKEGISLVLLVRPKGRITTTDKNINQMLERIFCKYGIATLLVITHCEFDNPVHRWWMDNKQVFLDYYKMKFDGTICVCAADDDTINKISPEIQLVVRKYKESSKSRLIKAIDKYANTI